MLPTDFDWKKYLIINPDVAKTQCSQSFAEHHWLQYGDKERRFYRSSNIPNFDWIFYTTHYFDLHIFKTEEKALQHYIEYGRVEKRVCSFTELSSRLSNRSKPNILIIAHESGGGSETFYQRLVADINFTNFVTLRPINKLQLEIPNVATLYFPSVNDEFAKIIRLLSIKSIYTSQLVGYDIPQIVSFILDLKVPYIVTLHDGYYLYHDLEIYKQPQPPHIKKFLMQFLRDASVITAPSQSLIDFYHQHIPDLKIKVVPHETIIFNSPKYVTKNPLPLRVGIIGKIDTVGKGRRISTLCSHDAYNRNLPLNFIVFGTFSGDNNHITVTGRYSNDQELFSLLDKYQPNLLWIPGLYHESYCYVLTLILMSGLPCIFPDLPIYRERTTGFIGCHLYPSNFSPSQINDQLLSYYDQLPDKFSITTTIRSHVSNPEYKKILSQVIHNP